MMRVINTKLLALAIICGLYSLFVGCTGNNVTAGRDARPPGEIANAGRLPALPGSPSPLEPSLSSLPVPDGVATDVWQQLTAELEKQLIAVRGARHIDDGLLIRSASTPPTRPLSQTMLSATATELRWGYYSNGDYDQNGEVNVADLTPLAIHFQETAWPFKFVESTIQAVIDGDGNGEINLADVTPIALNFQNNVSKYNIYRSQTSADYPDTSDSGNGDANLIGSLELSSATGTPNALRLQFASGLPDALSGDYFWVRPVDNQDTEGIASNRLGPLTTTFTLDGHVYMAGGGIDPLPGVPIELTEESTVIATSVTDINGHYSFDGLPAGTYTVTPTGDPYGYSPETIDLAITNADKYLSPIYPAPVNIVHTWVADETFLLSVYASVLDSQNSVYLTGATEYEGEEVVFVFKYDMFGNLLWRRFKQFGSEVGVPKLLLDGAGNIYVGGSYTTAPNDDFNRRYEDVFVLKLDSSGSDSWLFSYSSTTPDSTDELQLHHDHFLGMEFDSQGNLVILGNANGVDGSPNFLLKVNPAGELVEEKYLSLETDDYWTFQIYDMKIDSLGNIFASGSLSQPFDNPASIMKMNADGQVSWLNHWGSEYLNCETQDIKLGWDGSIFAASDIQIDQTGGRTLSDAHLARLTPDGGVTWEVRVSRGTKIVNPDLAIGPMEKLWVSASESFDGGNPSYESTPFLMSFDQNGNLRFVRRWYDAENFNRSGIKDISVNSYGVAVMVGFKGYQHGAWETPEVSLDYTIKEQSTQAIVPYDMVGILDPTVAVADPVVLGEEDSEISEHQALIMYYRP